MRKELKRVVWEWLPGLVAGLIPLAVFLLVSVEAIVPTGVNPEQWWASFCSSLVDHLLIVAIVTSAVSTFTAFPRLFAFNRDDFPLGEGSLVLVMVITILLVFSVAMYVLRQSHGMQDGSFLDSGLWVAVGLALAAAATSYYLEVTIANLRFNHSQQKGPAAT